MNVGVDNAFFIGLRKTVLECFLVVMVVLGEEVKVVGVSGG